MNEKEYEIVLLATLKEGSFISFNKALAKKIGINPAIYIANLIGDYKHFRDNNELYNGYFYRLKNKIEEDTLLTPFQQTNCLDKLKELKIIDVIRKGVPPKYYYKINFFNLGNVLKDNLYMDSNILIKSTFKDKQSKSIINNNKDNNNKDNNSVSKETANVDLKKDIPKIKNNEPKRNRVLHISKEFQDIINIWNTIKCIITSCRQIFKILSYFCNPFSN